MGGGVGLLGEGWGEVTSVSDWESRGDESVKLITILGRVENIFSVLFVYLCETLLFCFVFHFLYTHLIAVNSVTTVQEKSVIFLQV